MYFKNRKIIYIFIVLITSLFLLRSIIFSSQFGSLEHDSGWYLGVARNLAERGLYASYTNTIKKEGAGVHPSIHGRFSVQDNEGFSYFPAGVTVGPAYLFPEALMMKLFGYGWWQFRLWPLVSFFGLLLVAFLIIYRLGGILGLVLFQVWLWVTPHITTQFAYESYGEHVALFYLLLSFYFIFLGQRTEKKKLFYSLSGVFLSLSFLTKYQFLLAGFAFIVLAIWQFIKTPNRSITLRKWIIWLVFLLLPILAFELYRFVFLVTRFGIESWHAVISDFIIHFKSNGSGLNIANVNWEFMGLKSAFWKEAGVVPVIAWCTTLLSPLIRLKEKDEKMRVLFLLLFASFLSTTIWFILFASFGWVRHVWPGLIIGMILISAFVGYFWNDKRVRGAPFLFVIFVLSSSFFLNKEKFEPRLGLNQKVIDEWDAGRYESGLQGLPANPFIALSDQEGLVNYFNLNIKDEDKIYYLGWFLVAEAPPLVDKVFYSLDRYLEIGQAEGPGGGKSYLIIGPYQKGKYSLVSKSYYPRKVTGLCEKVVFENTSYALCTLKNNLVYENRAYD